MKGIQVDASSANSESARLFEMLRVERLHHLAQGAAISTSDALDKFTSCIMNAPRTWNRLGITQLLTTLARFSQCVPMVGARFVVHHDEVATRW